jgi:murein L,D-transpeptidase YafK
MGTYRSGKSLLLHGLFWLSLIVHTPVGAIAEEREIWIMVDTQASVLAVMKGDEPKEIFKNISLGRNGAGHKNRRGDDTTPLGRYRVGWINNNSRYHRFFGINYPGPADAARAYKAGKIDTSTFKSLVEASQKNQIPSQKTILGGQIGIHGIGPGSLAVHNQFNWTHGCIALTNQQIDQLGHWLSKGTLVVVR